MSTYSDLKKAELLELAVAHGLDVEDGIKKADLVALLEKEVGEMPADGDEGKPEADDEADAPEAPAETPADEEDDEEELEEEKPEAPTPKDGVVTYEIVRNLRRNGEKYRIGDRMEMPAGTAHWLVENGFAKPVN